MLAITACISALVRGTCGMAGCGMMIATAKCSGVALGPFAITYVSPAEDPSKAAAAPK